MGVFHIFGITQMLPNRAKHHHGITKIRIVLEKSKTVSSLTWKLIIIIIEFGLICLLYMNGSGRLSCMTSKRFCFSLGTLLQSMFSMVAF